MSKTARQIDIDLQQARITELESQLSEVVTPELVDDDGDVVDWVEIIDGAEIPVMRGSPRLPEFITQLHREITNRDNQIQQLTAENERLEEENTEWCEVFSEQAPLILERVRKRLAAKQQPEAEGGRDG